MDPVKRSDTEIWGWEKRVGHGQTYPEKPKIRSDRGKNQNFLANPLQLHLYIHQLVLCNNYTRTVERPKVRMRRSPMCTSHLLPSPCGAVQLLDSLSQ